ncbi:transcriptional regulator [Halorubrum ezzemoulense DSM 17463]|uniref:Transcriptional regulator n=2 Tax=Halorubrum ezzemoulense TaxID=337243 RepID=A0A1X4G4S9_HALEZ|nr:transcriptional regulator [Halorubrum ezzemoulense DSM 17463]
MREPAPWMQMPIDDRILEALATSGLVLSPSVIAFNIDKARSEVNRRLSVLVDHGLVERVKRGYYRITETGEQYLAGDLDPDEL